MYQTVNGPSSSSTHTCTAYSMAPLQIPYTMESQWIFFKVLHTLDSQWTLFKYHTHPTVNGPSSSTTHIGQSIEPFNGLQTLDSQWNLFRYYTHWIVNGLSSGTTHTEQSMDPLQVPPGSPK